MMIQQYIWTAQMPLQAGHIDPLPDTSGVFKISYYGTVILFSKAKALRKEILWFHRCIHRQYSGPHPDYAAHWYYTDRHVAHYPQRDLEFRVLVTATERDAELIKWNLLKVYKLRHGQLPALKECNLPQEGEGEVYGPPPCEPSQEIAG